MPRREGNIRFLLSVVYIKDEVFVVVMFCRELIYAGNHFLLALYNWTVCQKCADFLGGLVGLEVCKVFVVNGIKKLKTLDFRVLVVVKTR